MCGGEEEWWEWEDVGGMGIILGTDMEELTWSKDDGDGNMSCCCGDKSACFGRVCMISRLGYRFGTLIEGEL